MASRWPRSASFWHARGRQPGERLFKEVRGQPGLDTTGNLVKDVDNIIQPLSACLPCCACHLMPQPSAVSQTTSTSRSSEPQPAPEAACRQAGSWKLEAAPHPFSLVLGKRLRACHHWHHQVYIHYSVSHMSSIHSFAAAPPPFAAALGCPARLRRPGCMHCSRPVHRCQCCAPHSRAAKMWRRFLRPRSQTSRSSFSLYRFLIGEDLLYHQDAPLGSQSQSIWGSTVFLVWACSPVLVFADRKARQACLLRFTSRQVLRCCYCYFLFPDLPAGLVAA
jgi:hypothetical protein